MTTGVFPKDDWERASPAEAGMNAEKLDEARAWLDDSPEAERYRVVIVRRGRLVAEWNRNVEPDVRYHIASAAKSVYSNVLGIAVAEGKIPSADAKVVDDYPEMMDVPEGEGPKDGRWAFGKDRDITFRQLISNTSGYMKPGEEPGKVFHYQTYGMNILTHAVAKVYGLYDVKDPEGCAGFMRLIEEKIARPIGADWEYGLGNFDLHEKARLHIFGYSCGIRGTAPDLARVGWLWCNWGRWDGREIIPETWMRESVKTAPDILSNCPEGEWQYGHGFWTNDHGQLAPGLPRGMFAASGAGGHRITVFPERELVVVQSPGPIIEGEPLASGNTAMLRIILDACD